MKSSYQIHNNYQFNVKSSNMRRKLYQCQSNCEKYWFPSRSNHPTIKTQRNPPQIQGSIFSFKFLHQNHISTYRYTKNVSELLSPKQTQAGIERLEQPHQKKLKLQITFYENKNWIAITCYNNWNKPSSLFKRKYFPGKFSNDTLNIKTSTILTSCLIWFFKT